MQWLQDLNQSNVDNLNNVRFEATRHFRNKQKEYLKANINPLKMKRRLLYLKTKFIPHSKHFSSWL